MRESFLMVEVREHIHFHTVWGELEIHPDNVSNKIKMFSLHIQVSPLHFPARPSFHKQGQCETLLFYSMSVFPIAFSIRHIHVFKRCSLVSGCPSGSSFFPLIERIPRGYGIRFIARERLQKQQPLNQQKALRSEMKIAEKSTSASPAMRIVTTSI